MRLSVVVVNWNSREDLRACLDSLSKQSHKDLEVIVVDNGSTDNSVSLVREEFPTFILIDARENLGFAEGCNRGIERSSGEWVAMLNNDAIADPEWAHALVRAAKKVPVTCGMLQSLMLFLQNPNTVNSTGIELQISGRGHDRHEGENRPESLALEEIFCPTAGAAAYRRSMLDAIKLPEGFFDRSHFCYFEDMDLGWRARLNGWSAIYVPDSIVLHRYHGSSERRGKAWLLVISRTNRLRTLTKNASLRFLARSAHHSLYDVGVVFWHGGLRSVKDLASALKESAAQRSLVSEMSRTSKRTIEKKWTT